MAKYIARRLAATVVMAIAATFIVFFIAHFVPTDPVQAQLGDRAAANPEIVAAFRQKWDLDRPAVEQYLTYLGRLAQGDLGESLTSRRPVLADITEYFPATIELASVAALLALLIGIPLGIAAAVWRDSMVDHLARLVSLLGVGAPTFWLAFIMLATFYGGLHIAPGPGRLSVTATPPPTITGLFLVDSAFAGQWRTFGDALAHLVLPSIVLAASSLGLITRTTRASMLETLGQDYVRTARAKGASEVAVVLRHALRNALIPIVTLAGLAYAQLLSGAVMTESIFSWPGLGRYSFQAAVALDFPAITGITLVVALVYLLINLMIDITYPLIDPRVVRQ